MKRILTTDRNLQLIQDNVDASLIPLNNSALYGVQLIPNVSLISGQNNLVPHKLGKVPVVILPCAPSVQSTIWSPNVGELNNKNASAQFINLICSVSCIVSVLVA